MPPPHEIAAATLHRLLALARDLLQVPDTRSILELVGPALQELLAADGALLLLKSGDHELLTEYDRNGRLQSGNRETTLSRQARRALRDGTPILLPDASVGSWAGVAGRESMSLLAFPFPPIRPLGVLAAWWSRRAGHPQIAQQIPTLRHIGELTGAALGNLVLRNELEARIVSHTREIEQAAREHAEELGRRNSIEDELRRIAVTDVMTGMLNRRGFFLEAEHSLRLARRRGEPSALIFADIDKLKAVNDLLGHHVGDQLIQDGAAIFKASFRDSDVIARLGGDEFAAFTADSAQPEAILSRIRENIEEFHARACPLYRISFSTGIVTCDPASESTLSDYLSQADRQMYEQKKRDP